MEDERTLPERHTDQSRDRLMNRMIRRAEEAIAALPDYPLRLVALADGVAAQDHPLKAFELCRKAMGLAQGDPQVLAAGRQLLCSLVPGYHLPMMNDTRRNQAWDQALRRAIRPGARVLEIGTGAGMLALMAARAGARVTTCEFDPVVAAVAQEVVERNGFSDSIKVISKSSLDLAMGVDVDEPADLLFCDNFSDNMFSFQPLKSIADARMRLLKPDAPSMPAAASVRLALADWESYSRLFYMDRSCGFDVSFLGEFVPDSVDLDIGDPTVSLLSEGMDAFRFDFSNTEYPETEAVDLALCALREGRVSGVAQWIRLELDDQTALEAKPEPGAIFFSNPRFYPLVQPITVRAGDTVKVRALHDGKSMNLWPVG